MQIFQGMDADRMIIIFPSALVVMYLIIMAENSLCKRLQPYGGLIIPAICFIAATVLAVRPLVIADPGDYDGLISFCIRMWLTFNIATIVFLVPYFKYRYDVKAGKYSSDVKAGQKAIAEDSGDQAASEK